MWGTAVDADADAREADDADGFEWCEPIADDEREADALTDAAVPPDATPQVEPVLDPGLATETRLDETDDEAVALLAALRRDPAYGRWRQADAEFGRDEP